MPLEPATRLGIYEVLGPLGAGGMGEVYRARDTRLGRDVAIKVLPEGVAKDETQLARFEREARLLASLNHPGIAAVYGFEEADGIPYIVMELVPGETLTQRLAAGALTLADSLSLASQIAEALEAAHERGVVHRDLKPANIKITPEGKVKVLDLGLAKAFDVKSASGEDMSRSPTLVLDQTRPGVILGTAEFMSPEQARGKEVDKRTDIWAFGCILYEMLSGRRAFSGESISDVMVAILDREPNWGALPERTPLRIRGLLARCLQKNINRRLRDIGDARLEIEESLAAAPQKEEPVSAPRPVRWAVLGGLALLLAGGVLWLSMRDRDRAPEKIPTGKSLVVLPFGHLSGQPDDRLVGDGLMVTVSARLAKIKGIRVVTPAAAANAAERESDPYQIARNLEANLILSLSYQRHGDRMRITYSLLNTAEKVQLDGDVLTGPASELFAMQDQLAEKVAESLKLSAAGVPTTPTGLETASEQDRYLQAIGRLQRYERPASVEEAIRLLETLAREKPGSALVHAALGRAYLNKFQLTRVPDWARQALASCQKAKLLDPDLAEVRITAGQLLTETGRSKEAVAELKHALASLPESSEAARSLGVAYAAAGEPERAEASLRRAATLEPGYWAAHNSLGVFFFERGRYADAAEAFRRVTALSPDNRRGYDNLGGALAQMGHIEEARRAYATSIALDPLGVDAYNNLGTLEFSLGRFRDSIAAYEKAARLTPEDYLVWANLGDAYRWGPGTASRASDAYRKAIALAAEELRLNPDSASVRGTLALCYAKMGERERAASHLQRALELDPQRIYTLYQAAVVETLAGRPRQAVEWIAKALEKRYPATEIERDPEFASLKEREDFQEMIRARKRLRPEQVSVF